MIKSRNCCTPFLFWHSRIPHALFDKKIMTRLFRFAIVLGFCFLANDVAADDDVDFNRQIRPLLNKHCIACHGPDEGDRQADLRLDTFKDATDYAIVAGDAKSSDVFDRITTDDEELRMPPADHADALKPDEVELVRKWIDQGAKYQEHWSFAPIIEPKIPRVKLSAGATNPVIHNEIDNFILKGVHANELEQNPMANPASLVRRVSLDLTGLPPVSHDAKVQKTIEAYLQQPNQKRFGELVDQLLATSAFAEHWASVWLDIARYADTCGYSGDEKRDIWPWRDWLIRSLQENKSYKDLSIEMLAGDLLPNATKDQQLATAFHRNTLANNEGGTNDEEFRTIAVKDRLSTTLNAWMGLTVRCAECHSHKYDPISHVEYYQLLDFFNHTVDADNRDDRPKLEVRILDPQAAEEINQQIAKLKETQKDQPDVWNTLRPEEMKSRAGTKFELLKDDSILAFGPLPGVEEYAFTFEVPASTKLKAIRLEALPDVRHNGNVGRAPEGSFILSQIRFAKIDSGKPVDKRADEKRESNSDETILPFAKAANSFNQVNRHAKNAILVDVKPGGNQGWAINHPVDGYRTRQEAVFELKEPMVADEVTRFKIYLLFDPPWKRLTMGRVRVSFCEVDDAVAKYDKKQLDPINREITDLITKRDAPVRVPVIQERAKNYRRETHVNLRGNFQSKGEKVTAKFPDAFALKGGQFSMDRLGLANWMFDKRNPLTARVAVNRYWARVIGSGIVESEEDFGTQGTMPSHPELLDHLAIEFRRDWDVQRLLRKIVMSATYQQSQLVSKKMLEVDPRNRLLARGPRVRLSAEVVRDQALAVSGLLSRKMYGKPVYPPNPIKRVVNAFTGGFVWQESQGEDRYRRAIYTFLKRSAPHPLFETFDVSNRDVCSMRRLRTNTPLQSFMTLNDITFVEAARALGEKMVLADKMQFKNDAWKLRFQLGLGVKSALFEEPDEKQIKVLSRVYQKSVRRFKSDLESAAKMVGAESKDFDAEKLSEAEQDRLANHAAMTVVSNVILNLDSFLNN